MAIDQGDLPKSQEVTSHQKPRLLFNLADNNLSGKVDSMRKLGLLSSSPSLTPSLDMAAHYTPGGEILTFWYPQKQEVDDTRFSEKITPTVAMTDELKASMFQKVNEMDLREGTKELYRGLIGQTTTYLPGERLRAVARGRNFINLMNILPTDNGSGRMYVDEEETNLINVYADPQKRETLITNVKKTLEEMEIDFFDSTLNRDILAEDIVRTVFEHVLLNAVRQGDVPALQAVTYEDPVYERYRKMLVGKFERKPLASPEADSPIAPKA